MLNRGIVGTELASNESDLHQPTVHSNGTEEVASFVRIMWSFLALNPAQPPSAAKALLDPAFQDRL